MSPLTQFRPLLAAAALSAVGFCASAETAAAQGTGITGSLPDSHPMKDGGTGEGPFGATGSFTRSGGGIGGIGSGGLRGGFGGRGYLGGSRFGYGNYYGFGNYYGYGGGAAYYPYGIGSYANPVVGLNQGGAYLVPGPVPYYGLGYGGYGYGLGNNYLGYPAYGGRYTNYGGNPNAFTMGPHRNSGAGFNSGFNGAGLDVAGPAVGPLGAGPNPALDEAFREQADRWRAPIDLGDAGPLPGVPRPADERELAEALRDERAADEAFSRLDYRKALTLYRRAADVAPTRGEPLYKSAFARIALGQFAAAGEELRRAVALNPALPTTGPTLREMFGPDHSIARTAALGGVAEHARADVRDPDRLFLLGAAMHANGDDRAREIFEAAWRLTGGRPHLRPYLDPVKVNFGSPAGSPADLAPLAAPAPAESPASDADEPTV
ncbi:hypothetical protein [Alienimonas chondri]|uniref:Tetratricopeptide repeat protein n=1 Tax=Alienimonas chondri TaxID=2681879 RepID=A0ABX1V9U0_9PLAN|nr:hypothetical protein [Alienimonas chondri]NNJ24158.1 hypothetical protein [Alienimonas chondri]